MTMTETKLSDEEIQKLIERLYRRLIYREYVDTAVAANSLNTSIDALRQLQAENKALKEDKRKQHDALCIAKECMTVIYSDHAGDYYMDQNLSDDIDAIDAALQQEKSDG